MSTRVVLEAYACKLMWKDEEASPSTASHLLFPLSTRERHANPSYLLQIPLIPPPSSPSHTNKKIPMATKAALTAALLMTLVALASATTFTTTVTTTSFEEEGNPRQQQCRQQLQGREFRSCQRYFSQRSSSPFEEEEVLEMSTGRQTRHRQPQLNECCEQLREMDRQQCGCEAIKHAVQKAQQQQQGGRSRYQTGQSESEQIYQKARSLPRMCGLREQQCQFRVVLI